MVRQTTDLLADLLTDLITDLLKVIGKQLVAVVRQRYAPREVESLRFGYFA